MNGKEQIRKLQLILVMAFSIYPLILIVLKSMALGLLPFGWAFPLAYVVLAMTAINLKGSIRLGAGIAMSAGFVAAVFFLAPADCRFGGILAALIGCAALLLSLKMGGWSVKQEIPVLWIAFCIIAHLAGQMAIRMDSVSGELYLEPYRGGMMFALLTFALLTLLSMNRGGLMAASGKRQSVPGSMRRRNVMLVIAMFLLAVLASLLPSVLSSVMDVIETAIVWVVDFIARLIPDVGPEQVEDITSTVETLPEGMGGGGQELRLNPVVEKMMAACGAVISLVLVILLFYRIFRILGDKFRELIQSLGKFAASASEDYIDEVTDTREDITAEQLEKKRRPARMPLREPKNLEPVEKIRFRYRKLLRKHPEWDPGTTARETLPADAAKLYERARYSGLPVTEAEAEGFLK